ncbi:hypothetical protein [Sphingomonas gilva]|uniref:hypothetical protein n=1 Tax=Sphingomonas gilva TaxID=2305907 RepID=UPI0015F7D94F|nr:hypothetical protein [Sphingomonas gilva]
MSAPRYFAREPVESVEFASLPLLASGRRRPPRRLVWFALGAIAAVLAQLLA